MLLDTATETAVFVSAYCLKLQQRDEDLLGGPAGFACAAIPCSVNGDATVCVVSPFIDDTLFKNEVSAFSEQ